MSQTKYQGGSVVSFAVIGVLLVIVLIVGLYGLQRYSDSLEEAGQEIADTSQQETTDTSKQESNNKQEQPAPTEQDKQEENQNKQSPKEESKKQEPVNKKETNTPKETTEQKSNPENTEQLPVTGPIDSALQLVVASVVTFAGVSYLRSRQVH